VARYFSEDKVGAIPDEHVTLAICVKDQDCAVASGKLMQTVTFDTHTIAIFEITEASCLQVGPIRRRLISRYFRNKNTPAQDRMYGALYSYPRKVVAVSHVDATGYNIFPMDFQCLVEPDGICILGLRTTNITLQKILNTGSVTISNTHAVSLEQIYQLGSHHSASPPPMAELPFATSPGKLFGFPVPEFATGYSEIELKASRQLGTHMLMVGNVVNRVNPASPVNAIHHIHYFQSVYETYDRLN
jgi:flavin reductase (DIM6/NTAB) family NADH-FMN oxidoreductase RutF